MRRCRNGIKPCSCKSEVDLFVEQTHHIKSKRTPYSLSR